MNSLLLFEDYDTELWKFHDVKDQYAITGTSTSDFIEFDCYETWCFFKSNLGSDIQTFTSCDYNQQYFDGNFELAGRRCGRCLPGTPFSYGFAQSACKPCSDLEGNYDNLPDVEKFMFNVACPKGTVDRVNCSLEENKEAEQCNQTTDPGTTTDPNSGNGTDGVDEEEPDVERPVVIPPEEDGEGGIVEKGGEKEGIVLAEEEEDKSLMTWIIIGAVVVFVSLCAFASYKIY